MEIRFLFQCFVVCDWQVAENPFCFCCCEGADESDKVKVFLTSCQYSAEHSPTSAAMFMFAYTYTSFKDRTDPACQKAHGGSLGNLHQ